MVFSLLMLVPSLYQENKIDSNSQSIWIEELQLKICWKIKPIFWQDWALLFLNDDFILPFHWIHPFWPHQIQSKHRKMKHITKTRYRRTSTLIIHNGPQPQTMTTHTQYSQRQPQTRNHKHHMILFIPYFQDVHQITYLFAYPTIKVYKYFRKI